jgi:hypothetical protein
MNLKKIVLVLATAAAIIPSMAFAAPKMDSKMTGHKKGGYVHATTYVTKKGTVVHRKGGYRHATKGTMKAMAPKKAM